MKALINIIPLLIFLPITIITILYTFPTVRTDGVSMKPTYDNKTLLLATRLFNRKKLKVGRIYVFNRVDNVGETHLVIKRLKKILITDEETLCFFQGDNKTESYDSRHYGFINAENIVAKVLWRIKK